MLTHSGEELRFCQESERNKCCQQQSLETCQRKVRKCTTRHDELRKRPCCESAGASAAARESALIKGFNEAEGRVAGGARQGDGHDVLNEVLFNTLERESVERCASTTRVSSSETWRERQAG